MALRHPTRRLARGAVAVLLATLVVTAGLTTSVGAQTDSSSAATDAESVEQFLRQAIDAYRASGASVDVPGKDQVVGPMNVHVIDGPNTYVFSLVVTPEFDIEEFAAGPRADAKRRGVADYATLQEIMAADNPPRALEAAVLAGDIRVEAEPGHPIEAIKWAIVDLLRVIFGGLL
jgi:hypothetical protein